MNDGLTSVRLVFHQIYKFTVRRRSPGVKFADGVSHRAARIIGPWVLAVFEDCVIQIRI